MSVQWPNTGWVDRQNKTPYQRRNLSVHNAYFGTNLIDDARNNSREGMGPIFLGVDSDHDLRELQHMLIERGNLEDQRIGSFNHILVPRSVIKRGTDAIKRWVYDHYQYGGLTLEAMRYTTGSDFQNNLVTAVYGGKLSVYNRTRRKFDAFTKVCWTMPDIDSDNYPCVTNDAERNPTFAPVVLEPLPVMCDTAHRKWIHDSMVQYVREGRCSRMDHPLFEGSAYLLDGIMACAAIVLETAINKNGMNNSADALALITGAIAERRSLDSHRRQLRARTNASKQFKMDVVHELFNSAGRGELVDEKDGNAATRFLDASCRISEDWKNRQIGFTVTPFVEGGLGELQFNGYEY